MSKPSPAGNPSHPTWHEDWSRVKPRHERWWRQEELVFCLTADRDPSDDDLPEPPPAKDPEDWWIGLPTRIRHYAYRMSRKRFYAEAPPASWCSCIGPGDLAAMLGARWKFSKNTVWYEHCIDDPETHPPLELDTTSFAYRRLTEIVRAEIELADGRYLVGIPDLIENIDILAALRDPQTLLLDMFDNPEWIERSVMAINEAYFKAYDHFYGLVRDDEGWSLFGAFSPYGPGKTAKVQCDACSMFGPDQFERFVLPALTQQCDYLDFAMYHLDGEECWPNLDHILSIESLQALEWTPKFAYADEGGGHPKWYDLYKRILAAGKSVQAITVKPDEVIPLLDAVGPKGMYICCHTKTEAEAEKILERVEPYYASVV
ncbi:hypothetical protein [Mucisphaera calidilacus]|uniref:Trimethylamine corrinoid protein 2 n=1 Tax=Mucisphaera calidilacus TaxID=2527982 RepID=A0A518BUD4_9BACT|nr:hypothetical protein [Mucisphaera calidilacus]QDU70544.1 hypothetical protein Pan265_03720 [Mucisphaera calidilacus]